MSSKAITLRFASSEEVEISKKEAFRYMGIKAETLPDEMEELFGVCVSEFKKAVSYKACLAETEIRFFGNGRLDLGFGEIESFHLEKNLQGCKRAVVFAATTSIAVDRLINRFSKLQPSKSLMIDAVASAAVEDWCDIINSEISQKGETKPRFSCGYGDFSLSHQKDILELLDAQRKIGITLSESLMMLPVKSVTAIVGIKEEGKDDKKKA